MDSSALLKTSLSASSSAANLRAGVKNELTLNSAAMVFDSLPARVLNSALAPVSPVSTSTDNVVANLEVEGAFIPQMPASPPSSSFAGKVFDILLDSTSPTATKLVIRGKAWGE